MNGRPPVVVDVERPPAFQRAHVVLRVAVLIVVGWVGHPLGILWLGLPLVAAILVAEKGGARYLDEDGPTVTRVLGWIVGLVAYVALLTDELPGGGGTPARLELQRSGSPTTRSALLRILYAIPSAIALSILTFFAGIVWTIAVVSVLVSGQYPEGLWRFLRGVVGWEASLLVYLASLVDRYPPFAFEAPSVSPAS